MCACAVVACVRACRYEQTIETLRGTADRLRTDLTAATARDGKRIEELEQELAAERRDRRQVAAEEHKVRKEREELALQVQEYVTFAPAAWQSVSGACVHACMCYVNARSVHDDRRCM